MRVTVVGMGYVGLVTATCLARMGQEVVGLEADEARLAALERGEPPFFEPGLGGELATQRDGGRLRFTSDAPEALARPEVVMICVGTPSTADGAADLAAVESVVETIARHLEGDSVIALRSTVPIGTTRRMEGSLNQRLAGRGRRADIPIFANPEFLRTGRALEDFLRPSRVVIGHTQLAADDHLERLLTLYRPLDAPTFVFPAESAELVKNAANAFLATRISFINELAALCEVSGASIDDVIAGIAADRRIGGDYLRPGLGYGGSCLPKDIRSLRSMGSVHGAPMRLAQAVDAVNVGQPQRTADRIAGELGGDLRQRTIGLLGLAFKPDTDDIRDSPALALAAELRERGAAVVACDPRAGEAVAAREPWIRLAPDPQSVARQADLLVLTTEWPEYLTADLGELAACMRRPVLLDGRNALEPSAASAAGFRYLGIGRPATDPARGDAQAARPSSA
jgi:UDPglucose 6-dehydrogenase